LQANIVIGCSVAFCLSHLFAMLNTRSLLLAVAALLVAGAALNASAQTDSRNPTMTSQRFDSDKESLYALFSENKGGVSPEQKKRAYLAAKVFLRRYGGDNDNYVKEANEFLAAFEKKASEDELYTAYTAKNYAKAFELGRSLLKTDAGDFFVLGVLSEAGYENAIAGNTANADETIDYLRRAIDLIEQKKVAAADPFKSTAMAVGFLNNCLGWFLKDKSPLEAAAAFTKTVKGKSPYTNDPLTYYRLGVAILKGPYAQLSAEYNEKYGAQQSSPERRAVLEEINRLGTSAIDAYARAVALSDPTRTGEPVPLTKLTPEFRSKILVQLTALYQSFHNDSENGLTELIAGVLTKPVP
jgi:hypothetical protein